MPQTTAGTWTGPATARFTIRHLGRGVNGSPTGVRTAGSWNGSAVTEFTIPPLNMVGLVRTDVTDAHVFTRLSKGRLSDVARPGFPAVLPGTGRHSVFHRMEPLEGASVLHPELD